MTNTTSEYITVTSNLITNRGWFQVILNYYINGKRQQKWKSLGIKDAVGNKTKAKKKQKEVERQFEEKLNTPTKEIIEENKGANILFQDYLKNWVKLVKPTLELTTYGGYERTVKLISKYFEEQNIKLSELKTSDIQTYYDFLLTTRNIKYNTVRKYHAVIHKSLEDAVRRGLIETNVARNIKHQKNEQYIASYYNKQELENLFEVAKGSFIELHILLATYYALRREEVIGLTFDNINFVDKTISIRHTVTNACVEGHSFMVEKDRTKNMSSNRTLPLIPYIEELLLKEKEKQEYNKKIFGNSYNNKKGYILVDDEGELIKPDRVTRNFALLLEKNNLRKIRFHDLRHSCASLLLANGVNMKEIQQWLGHSTWSTTANIYSHLDSSSKINSANTIASLFSKSQ